MATVIEVNVATGEELVRPATASEQAAWKKHADAQLAREEAAAEAAAKQAADEQAWRDAVGAAGTVTDLRDVLLSVDLPTRPEVPPASSIVTPP